MRFLQIILLSFVLLVACNEVNEVSETGQVKIYPLESASTDYAVAGNASFYERNDNTVKLVLSIDATESGLMHPSHLHFGPASGDGKMALMLNPVDGATGKSETIISKLGDGTAFSFKDIPQFDGHIKVHLGDEGPDYKVILSAGNIGIADDGGSIMNSITDCKPDYGI